MASLCSGNDRKLCRNVNSFVLNLYSNSSKRINACNSSLRMQYLLKRQYDIIIIIYHAHVPKNYMMKSLISSCDTLQANIEISQRSGVEIRFYLISYHRMIDHGFVKLVLLFSMEERLVVFKHVSSFLSFCFFWACNATLHFIAVTSSKTCVFHLWLHVISSELHANANYSYEYYLSWALFLLPQEENRRKPRKEWVTFCKSECRDCKR